MGCISQTADGISMSCSRMDLHMSGEKPFSHAWLITARTVVQPLPCMNIFMCCQLSSPVESLVTVAALETFVVEVRCEMIAHICGRRKALVTHWALELISRFMEQSMYVLICWSL